MPDPRAETIDQLLLDRVSAATDLPEPSRDLLFAALVGSDELNAVLGGAVPQKPQPPAADAADDEPIGTYLADIEVTGFRGIGPTATLSLKPAPGLTIVTGRNGSGKSSFAEAAEYALTGDNMRWAERTAIWKDGWRNLHAEENPSIKVRLGVEGHPRGATVEHHWQPGDDLADGTGFLQLAGKPRQSIAELGWATALKLHRPFLSYAELGGLIGGKPSEMHDSLHDILGLGRLVEVEKLLKDARREMDGRRKVAAQSLPALQAALAAHPDPRARLAERALAGKTADLQALELLAAAEDPDDGALVPLRRLAALELPERAVVAEQIAALQDALAQVDGLAGTPAAEARILAGLLRDALAHQQSHPDQPCPVCGGRTLDAAWAEQAGAEIQRLTLRAEDAERVQRARRETCRALRHLTPSLPTLPTDPDGIDTTDLRITWQRWDQLVDSDDHAKIATYAPAVFDELAAALRPVRDAAQRALAGRQQAWQPVAERLRDWAETERAGRAAATAYKALQKTVLWLQREAAQIRNDQLAPLAGAATGIWNTLRQESNVELGAITLAGTGPQRRVKLDVNVDGTPGAALSVMSQGELHSLALALFLPRATMAQSPFRFLVIDDPVQSMDPVKVYGLAQVLAEVAKDRQVVVFTHDDRLPAAVRHLKIDARVLTVSRLARSQVLVAGEQDGDPAARYLNDAAAVCQDDKMPADVRDVVVASLIRDAIEFRCHELVRAEAFRTGKAVTEVEAAIDAAKGLRPSLALALLGDARRLDELQGRLNRLHPDANRVVTVVNHGAHGTRLADPAGLLADARRVVERLAQA
ncbi:AAA family ATPase [Melissospora conviva]|uniref:AAA family ATPase n=1 Tax=Melissospora conviva TaxID=3388432 RepID=UPI003B806356